MARNYRLREIEQERGEPLLTLIPRRLNELGSMERVADEFGVHMNTILRWCKENGVERETTYVIRTPDAEAV